MVVIIYISTTINTTSDLPSEKTVTHTKLFALKIQILKKDPLWLKLMIETLVHDQKRQG